MNPFPPWRFPWRRSAECWAACIIGWKIKIAWLPQYLMPIFSWIRNLNLSCNCSNYQLRGCSMVDGLSGLACFESKMVQQMHFSSFKGGAKHTIWRTMYTLIFSNKPDPYMKTFITTSYKAKLWERKNYLSIICLCRYI